MATAPSPFLSRRVEEQLQNMMMMVEQMASILQELRSMKTDVAKLRELWREEQLDQEDGGVPLPSILEQPTIIQEASKVQESEATTQEECQDSYIDGDCSSPSDSKTLSVLKSSTMESRIETHKEAKMMSNTSGLPTRGFAIDFRNREMWKNAKLSSRVNGSPSVAFIGVSSSVFPLPSSQSLFIVMTSVHEFSQVKKCYCVSRRRPSIFSEPEFLGLASTGMNKVVFEKSKSQLTSTFCRQQRYFEYPLGLIQKGAFFAVFQEKVPKSSLPWVHWLITKALFCHILPYSMRESDLVRDA